MFTPPPTESPRCRTVGKENGRNGSSGNRRKGFRRPVPAACLFEGELGQRLPWRAVTSMRRRFMSSMVQPMPVRATAARSMPFVFAPVDAMT